MNEFFGRNMTSEDRLEEKQIKKTLSVSNYIDEIFESLHTGLPPKIQVPNYHEPSRAELLGKIAAGKPIPIPSEQQGVGLNMDNIYKNVSDVLGEENVKKAIADTHSPRMDNQPTFATSSSQSASQSLVSTAPQQTISKNQWVAIKKFPTLVDFLGQPAGDKIAKKVSEQLNILLAEKIHQNSKQANEFAVACKPDKQNLKQYFQGEDWLCRVTASGPFRGDEVIYYSRDKDLACILRKEAVSEDKVTYSDISSDFNVIFEAEEGVVPDLQVAEEPEVEEPEVEEPEVEDSVEKTTSTVEEGDSDEENKESKEE